MAGTIKYKSKKSVFTLLLMIFSVSGSVYAQNIRFGIFADPTINWFSSDTKETVSNGSRPGFNFGINFNKYFGRNYSFSTGISLMRTGGRLSAGEDITMSFNNLNVSVDSGKQVIYKIQYVNIPIGLKFESTQIGYVRFFVDAGIDPRFLIGSKADIPSENISGETANKELIPVNLSYHVMGGIGYSIGGETELVVGLGFDHNFFDVTKEINLQPGDKVTNNIIRLRIGVNF